MEPRIVELQRETRSSIEMKMSAKGERYWDIKVYWADGDEDVAIDRVKYIDQQLTSIFLAGLADRE